jgi:uncharacterized delta-60 repeat protein
MKKVLVLMLGTILAVACGKTELPATTDSNANGAEVNSQAVRFPPTCLVAPAPLDNSFGNCGRVYVGIPTIPNAMVAQPDGKILLAGNNSDVYRLGVNGSFDTSFSDDGKVSLAEVSIYAGRSILQAIQVLADGKIVVAGNFVGRYENHWFVMRLNSDGSYDTSFGESLVYPYSGHVKSIAVQPDGKVVAVSSAYGTGEGELSRFGSDGSYEYGIYSAQIGDEPSRVFVLSSGRIVVVSNSINGPTATAFDTDGHLDPWFGNAGSVAPWKPVFRPIGDVNKCATNGSVQQGDDKIILTGNCDGKFTMARINANGSLDSSFGTSGKVSDASLPAMNAVTLRSDGRIVVGGGIEDFLLVGYNANGSKDSSWGNGRVVTAFPKRNGVVPVDRVTTLTGAADGKIIAAGSSFTSYQFDTGNGFALARYNP